MDRIKRLALISVGVAVIAIVVAISSTVLFHSTPRPNTSKTLITNTTEKSSTQTTTPIENNNATKAVALQKRTISVVSTASAFPFVQRWVAQYNNDEQALANIRISYLNEIDAYKAIKDNDMAILGHIARSYNNNYNSSYYIPVSAQAVAIVYNIPSFPDIPSGLKLNADLLSRIFNGNVTEWDDKAIKDLNEDLNLPHEKIIVIHEGQNSSSSDLLMNYIHPNPLKWPDKEGSSIIMRAPDELASMVRKTPYSIGYVDFSYTIQTKMTFAALANPENGDYILPSADSINQAVNTTLQIKNITSNSNNSKQIAPTPPLINSTRLGNGSYPIVGLYYAVENDEKQDNNSIDNRNATLDFIKWIIDNSKGQQILSEVQYPSIYNDNNQLLSIYAQSVITNQINAYNNTIAIASLR